MKYRVVLLGYGGVTIPISTWSDSPKGLGIAVVTYNSDDDNGGVYFLEEAPRR